LAELPKVPPTGSVETPKHGGEAKGKAAKEPELGGNSRATKNLEPTSGARIAKGIKGSCNNSQEEKDG
jgi:hypothetical protein